MPNNDQIPQAPVGKLTPLQAPQTPDYHSMADEAAKQYGIDPGVFRSLIQQESNWNVKAQSPKGAQGLTQLMPGTAKQMGVQDPFDPRQNLGGGAHYFSQLLQQYGGDVTKALQAYNAGPGAVARGQAGNIPETQRYVQGVEKGAGIPQAPVGKLRPMGSPQQQPNMMAPQKNIGVGQSIEEGIGRAIPDWAVGPMAGFQKYVNEPLGKAAEFGARKLGDVLKGETQNPSSNIPGGPQMFNEQGPLPQGFGTQGFSQVPSGIASGIGETVGGTIGDPRNWPFLAAGAVRPLLQRAISGGFALQMGHGAVEAATNLYQNWDNMTPEDRANQITQSGLGAIFAEEATRHAATTLKPGTAPRPATIDNTGRELGANLPVSRGGTPPGGRPESYNVAPGPGEKAVLSTEGGPQPVTRAGQTAAGQGAVGAQVRGGRAETTAIAPVDEGMKGTTGTVTPKPTGPTPEGEAFRQQLQERLRAARPASVSTPETPPQQTPAGGGGQGAVGPLKAPEPPKPEVQPIQQPEIPKAPIGELRPLEQPRPIQAAKPPSEATRRAQDRQMTERARGSIRPETPPAPSPRPEQIAADERTKFIKDYFAKHPGATSDEALESWEFKSKTGRYSPEELQKQYGEKAQPVQQAQTPAPSRAPSKPVQPSKPATQKPVRTAGKSVPEPKQVAPKTSLERTGKPVEAGKAPAKTPLAEKVKGAVLPKAKAVTDQALIESRAKQILAKDPKMGMGAAIREAKLQLQKEQGFFSLGGKGRPKTGSQKKAAKEARIAKVALKHGNLRSGLSDLTDAVSSLPDAKLDDRVKSAREAIKASQKGLSPKRQALANVVTNIGLLKDWYMKGAQTGLRIGDALRGNTDPKTAFHKIMGDWDKFNQEADYDLDRWANEAQRAHKPEILSAIALHRDVGGDMTLLNDAANDPKLPARVREAAKLATQLTPDELKTADEVRNYMQRTGEELMALGALPHMVENYMPHIYRDMDHPYLRGVQAEFQSGVFDTRFKYAMKRIFGNYIEAARAGKIPKDLRADFLTAAYDRTARQAISARAALKELYSEDAEDNRPLLAASWDSIKPIVPEEYANHPIISQILKLDPSLKKEVANRYVLRARGGPQSQVLPIATMKALGIPFDEKTALGAEKARMSMEGYKAVPNWAFKKWVFAGEGPKGKPVFYEAELWAHPSIEKDLTNLYKESQFRQYTATRAALKLTSGSKKILLSWLPSGFHYTQEGWHAVGHGVNPFATDVWNGDAVEEAIKGTSANAKINQQGMKNGLMLYDTLAGDKFGEGIGGDLLGQKEHLFKKFVGGLKAKLYPKQFRENMETYGPKGYTEEQVHQMTARQVNGAFGMQDEVFSGRSKFMADLFRLVALAPDFLESRARFVGQSLRPGGKYQRRALLRQGVLMYSMARMLNAWTNDGDGKWDPSDAFTWYVKGQKVSIRSVLTDAWFAATDFGGFIATRGALIPRAFAESYHELRAPKWQKTKGSAVDAFIRSQAPIMLQGTATGLWRKYVEGKEGENIALDTFRSIMEGMFGVRMTRDIQLNPRKRDTEERPPRQRRSKY